MFNPGSCKYLIGYGRGHIILKFLPFCQLNEEYQELKNSKSHLFSFEFPALEVTHSKFEKTSISKYFFPFCTLSYITLVQPLKIRNSKRIWGLKTHFLVPPRRRKICSKNCPIIIILNYHRYIYYQVYRLL